MCQAAVREKFREKRQVFLSVSLSATAHGVFLLPRLLFNIRDIWGSKKCVVGQAEHVAVMQWV